MGYTACFIWTKILERRREFVDQVNEIISDIHYKLTGGKERIRLIYEESKGNLTFEQALKKYRERDIRMKEYHGRTAQGRPVLYE